MKQIQARFTLKNKMPLMGCSGVVASKHGLYAESLGSIPTAAGGDAEHVSLNH